MSRKPKNNGKKWTKTEDNKIKTWGKTRKIN